MVLHGLSFCTGLPLQSGMLAWRYSECWAVVSLRGRVTLQAHNEQSSMRRACLVLRCKLV
jgi:hypothetical protein